MSPLRYQKWLRLNEVRRPMLNEHYDVTTAAYAVGYESYPISVGNIRGCLESNGFPAYPLNTWRMHQMQTTRTPYSISFMATVLLLLLFACHSTVANAAVALGATRVIYPANQKQVLLPVTNNDPASVYLIQSWIENAGDQKDTQFVITPPLF